MENAGATNRRGKRDDDDDCDQPVQKVARREAEKENEESASDLSKKELDKEFERRLAGLRKQLADARDGEKDANSKKDEIARENDALKIEMIEAERREEGLTQENETLKEKFEAARREEELAKKLHFVVAAKNFALCEELDEARKREMAAIKLRDEWFRENTSLKIEMDKLKRREKNASYMKNKLKQEDTSMKEELDEARRMKMQAHYKESQLTRENSALKEELNKLTKTTKEDKRRLSGKIDELEHSANLLEHWKGRRDDIFQLLCPSNRHGITIETARRQLLEKNHNVDWKAHAVAITRYDPDADPKNHKCKVCNKELRKTEVVEHFVSKDHGDKVTAHDAGVSRAAVNYWIEQTEKVIEYTKKEEAKQPINIFRLCQKSDTPDAITIDNALSLLQDKNQNTNWVAYRQDVYGAYSILGCEVCVREFKMFEVVDHFCSEDHVKKVKAHDAGVSNNAVQHWLKQMEKYPKAQTN